MSFKIKVAWRIENGEAKGRIIEDVKGRRKIVFLARNFSGRRPRDGEITDALIEKDTKPEEVGRGALLVSPRYAPDTNALSDKDVRAKLNELARAALPVFDEMYIEVNLPGWKGNLTIKFPRKWFDEGPLSVSWSFHAENGHTLFDRLEMTSAIRFIRQRGLIVTDLAQAIKDLGEPKKTKGSSLQAILTWTDRHGYSLCAEVSCNEAKNHGCVLQNFRIEDRRVVADISMLNGKWVQENQGITSREFLYSDTGELSRADFDQKHISSLSEEQRRAVVLLAQSVLHSPAWYQQYVIAEALNPQATGSLAVWYVLKQLKVLAEDMYTPLDQLEWTVPEIDRLLANVNKLRALKPSYRGQGNPEIYTSEPEDSEDVARMEAENIAMLTKLKAEYDEVMASADLIRELRRDPSFYKSIDSELVKLESESDKAIAGLNRKASADTDDLRLHANRFKEDLQRNRKYLTDFQRGQYTRQDCEQWVEGMLICLQRLRRRWQDMLEYQQRLDAAQADELQPAEQSA